MERKTFFYTNHFFTGKASSISKALQTVTTVQGEDAVFTCEVTQAGSSVKWAKDGKAIKVSQKYEISQQDTVRKLIIRSVSSKDCGEYSCEVVGGATTKAKLEIKGKNENLKSSSVCLNPCVILTFCLLPLTYG